MLQSLGSQRVKHDLVIEQLFLWGLLGGSVIKNFLANAEAWVQSLVQEDPLEKEMATHFSVLAWEIPWTEEPGVFQSVGLTRVRHNLATKQQSIT